jgi:hypothetical protein
VGSVDGCCGMRLTRSHRRFSNTRCAVEAGSEGTTERGKRRDGGEVAAAGGSARLGFEGGCGGKEERDCESNDRNRS